jgi:hypothetical protein
MALSLSKISDFSMPLKSWRAGAGATALLILAALYKIFTGQFSFFSETLGYGGFPELGGVAMPHYSPFTPSFLRSIWPLAAAVVVLSLLAMRLIKSIATACKNSLVGNEDGQSGSSAVEFILVLPPLVVLLLMILQIALIVQAKFVVNYAAFCAARSAIVMIPNEISSAEPRNQLSNPETSNKIQIIHRAAALPLTAISPLPGLNMATGIPVLTNPDAVVDLLKLAPFDVGPRSMMAQVMLRAPYAYDEENTAVKVLTQQGLEGGSFRDHDWVTVKVKYRYYLAVPFAKKLFGTSYSGNPILNLLFGADYYYPIVEQYTLPMDGEPSGL